MKEELKIALQKKAEQITAGAEIIAAKTRDWQVIKHYLSNRLNDINLTDEQEVKLERYQYIYNQLVSGKYTDVEVINSVQKIYNIKITQAYEDMNATRELFNTVININKQFELNLALQLNKNYMRKCEELGDMKALAAFEKNKALLIKELPEVDDQSAEFFEGHTYELAFNPVLLGAPPITKEAMKELLNTINAKRNKKIKIDLFDELEFKDIPDGD